MNENRFLMQAVTEELEKPSAEQMVEPEVWPQDEQSSVPETANGSNKEAEAKAKADAAAAKVIEEAEAAGHIGTGNRQAPRPELKSTSH